MTATKVEAGGYALGADNGSGPGTTISHGAGGGGG